MNDIYTGLDVTPTPVSTDCYADHRCPDCRHLVYAGEVTPGECCLCECDTHRRPGEEVTPCSGEN